VLHVHEVDAKRRAAMARALGAVGSLTVLPAAALPAASQSLAPPDRIGGMAQALARRRSVRRYGTQPLALAAISQLLWAAQGITTTDGRRTAPSAGALYPLEIHLLATRIEGLAAGVYRYWPATHALQLSIAEATAPALQEAALGQQAVGTAAAVVVIAAVEERCATKYGARAGRYVAIEAGAASQNLALQVAALGLGAVVIGAFDDGAVSRALRLPPGERPVVLMPVGAPA
jgi:SagB-type dehydrogenase family enzyme